MKAIRLSTQICINKVCGHTRQLANHKGASVVEYIVLTVIIFSALFFMKDTMLRGIFAKHKMAGDSFAFGRQYDARRTTVCRQDVISYDSDGKPLLGPFYDEDCYHARVMRPVSQGGCPQCRPGEKECFDCEDIIKNSQCNENEYCNS